MKRVTLSPLCFSLLTSRVRCRGALLALAGTALGVFAAYSAPDYVASWIGRVLPIWFYENQPAITTVGAVVTNFLFVSLLR